MFTRRRGNVATLLPPPQGHVGDVGLLATDDSKHGAGNIAQVLLGQPHDQQVVMNSVSKEQIGDSKAYFNRNDTTVNANVGPKLCVVITEQITSWWYFSISILLTLTCCD